MDRTIVRIGARSRSGAWHISALLALGALIVAACGGSKDITGPPLGTAAGLVMVVQPPATVADRATITPAPVVQVVDRAGTPVDTAGLTVTASIATGGGSLSGTTTAITNASGQVTFNNLKIAGTIGARALQFTASGISGIQASSVNLTAGPATHLVSNSLVSQTGVISQAVSSVPSVKALDADGNGVSGIVVTFAVTAGGGSVTGATPTTGSNGVATVGSWTLGSAVGANSLTATSGVPLTGSPVTFDATGATFVSAFNIELQFILPPSQAQLAAFNAAKARWQQVITGDLGAFNVGSVNTGANCGNQTVSGSINDMRIIVQLDSIDGVGNILGASSPCYLRNSGTGTGLPIISYMLFDTADVAGLVSSGNFGDVVLHEMGHSLGYGTIWTIQGMVNTLSSTNPFFTGSAANAAYLNSNGGSATVTPPAQGNCSIANNEVIPRTAVPVENSGGAGTALSHWEECLFRSEVMSGYITGNVRPLSLTTVESMADLGYTVNPSAADAFNINTQPSLRIGQPDTLHIELKSDVLQIPMFYLDQQTGRVTPAPRR